MVLGGCKRFFCGFKGTSGQCSLVSARETPRASGPGPPVGNSRLSGADDVSELVSVYTRGRSNTSKYLQNTFKMLQNTVKICYTLKYI